jgi:hypothetical protein
MDKKFVSVLADVDCRWEGLNPVYRLYVNDELFTERTWLWTNEYLEEFIQIEAEPGEYQLRWELVPPHLAKLTVKNIRVDVGPGEIVNDKTLRISNESV